MGLSVYGDDAINGDDTNVAPVDRYFDALDHALTNHPNYKNVAPYDPLNDGKNDALDDALTNDNTYNTDELDDALTNDPAIDDELSNDQTYQNDALDYALTYDPTYKSDAPDDALTNDPNYKNVAPYDPYGDGKTDAIYGDDTNVVPDDRYGGKNDALDDARTNDPTDDKNTQSGCYPQPPINSVAILNHPSGCYPQPPINSVAILNHQSIERPILAFCQLITSLTNDQTYYKNDVIYGDDTNVAPDDCYGDGKSDYIDDANNALSNYRRSSNNLAMPMVSSGGGAFAY
jgi:hypothetical protein